MSDSRHVATRHTRMAVDTSTGHLGIVLVKHPEQTSTSNHYGPWHGGRRVWAGGLGAGNQRTAVQNIALKVDALTQSTQ